MLSAQARSGSTVPLWMLSSGRPSGRILRFVGGPDGPGSAVSPLELRESTSGYRNIGMRPFETIKAGKLNREQLDMMEAAFNLTP